ncbi:polyamine aminopropyltransferase [Paenibacillus sp. BK720]|uniref:polyamine aminopropyltransferase n=1 Tax=Paenibacillus sp. BK720 TaxID=2587092 RepID=UPI0014222902|nr:polyamine aminopropyltransferase [Paenibacillus sp. BK720]NIK69050.1 spermidine synthase [Paenibacillus sp. BK720]
MKRKSLTGFQIESNEDVWLWDDLPELEMEVGYKVKALLHYEQSPFQEISIVETKGFGRMLVLDGTPQVSSKDGFIYNEMITHIAMTTHPEPKYVAMIGGGDCGPAREAVKYGSVQQVEVVEIDERVTEVCKAWMTKEPDSDKIRMTHKDGATWIQGQKKKWDVLLVDRSDPYGPAVSLYKPQFYQNVYESLAKDGIAVFQSGSPYYNLGSLSKTINNLGKYFPIVHAYLCSIPSFPGGIWSFVVASKTWDPLAADLNRLQWQNAKYINPEIFKTSFVLPQYIKQIIERL